MFYLSAAFERLQSIVADLTALRTAGAVLSWDQETYMPPAGASARARHRAVLARLAHETFTSDEVGRLLEQVEGELELGGGSEDGSGGDPSGGSDGEAMPGGLTAELKAHYVRHATAHYERARKLPSDFVQRMAAASAEATEAWRGARARDDWAAFAPHLERLVELTIEKTELLGYEDDRYDALLDSYEPGMPTSAVVREFDTLRNRLVPLVEAVAEAQQVDDSFLQQAFDVDEQWEAGMDALRLIGFDLERGRQDRSAHPFTTSFSSDDVRITTRIRAQDMQSGFFATLHEAGHGIHAQGIPAAFVGTPLTWTRSLGIGESQSRLWENVIGRSRGFWEYFLPVLRNRFPAQLGDVGVDEFYRAINKVEPSLIRVEADELTYNLHIFIRFHLERQLISQKLAVRDLPEAWNERMRDDLGVVPDSDAEGVLQDIHWSGGAFGYFPTYSLGNVLSVQFYDEAVKAHPDIPEQIRQGRFETLRVWTNEAIHRHGGMFEPMELVRRVTGRSLDSEPYLRYLEKKYGDIYRL